MSSNIANDRDFETAFAVAYVSKSKLARYYLEALERTHCGDLLPELILNRDTNAVNLEHVMPQTALIINSPNVDEDASYVNRIGNLVLLNAKKNSSLGNDDFAKKRLVFAESAFQLTKDVAGRSTWSPAEIDQRQVKLAALAVRTWSMKIN